MAGALEELDALPVAKGALNELDALPVSNQVPGMGASFVAGAKERGRQLLRGIQQLGARGGLAGPEDSSAYDPAAVERNAQAWEQQVLTPENARARAANQSYQQAHPYAYGAGGVATDIAATIPVALAAPELAPLSLGQRAATLGTIGAAQGGLLGLAEPVQPTTPLSSLVTGQPAPMTTGQYGTAKARQTAMGAGIGGVTAPLLDMGARGLLAAPAAAGRWLGRKMGLLPTPASPVSPAEMATVERQVGKPGMLTQGELAGDPAMMRRESNLEYATGSGMPEFRSQQYQTALDIANRQRAKAGAGLPEEPGQIVTQELQQNLANQQRAAQGTVENVVSAQQPPGVTSADRGIKVGLESELARRKGEAGKLYATVDQTLKTEGLAGSAIPTPNTYRETQQVLQEINPDTWRSLASPRLNATLGAIKQGLNDTTQLDHMPLENLAQVAQSAADRAITRFPDQTAAVQLGASRSGMIQAIQEYNRLATASPSAILGPRPAGTQGMLYAIKNLGGLKSTYMADAIGESKQPRNTMVGLFTKNGQSPDELARGLGELGYPVDDSIEGVNKLYDYIRRNTAGEKTVANQDIAQQEAQRLYDEQTSRARMATPPEQWLPGQALDFAGMRRLRQDLGDFYGKAMRAGGGIGSQESRSISRLMAAIDQDTQNWAETSGSPKLLQQLDTANRYYQQNVVPYFKTETPEVTRVIGNNEADRARVSLFRNDQPELAKNVYGMMTPTGQQSAKWGVWQDALTSATQSGNFNRDAFLGYFNKNNTLLKTVFNQKDWEQVQRVSDYLGGMKIDPGVENAVNRAMQTGDTDALLAQFSKANKPLLAERITARLLSPESKQATEAWLIEDAYNKAMDTRSGILSLKRFTGELAKYGEVFNQVSSPERVQELKGVMLLLDRASAASQYLQNPRTGVQLVTLLRNYGPMATLGGVLGGALSPSDSWQGSAAGAMIGASAAGTMGPILMRKVLTEPWGRALSRRLGAMDTVEADRYLQTSGTKNLLEKMLFSLSAIGANRAVAGSQQTQ